MTTTTATATTTMTTAVTAEPKAATTTMTAAMTADYDNDIDMKSRQYKLQNEKKYPKLTEATISTKFLLQLARKS